MSDSHIGKTFKDTISGFTGLCTGHTFYISGCDQLLLAPKVNDKGELQESHWFDVQRCQQVGETVVTLDNAETPGHDKPAPKK